MAAHATLTMILKAQEDGDGLSEGTYLDALRQIRGAGRKSSCWIWWVFPTMLALRPRTSRPKFLLADLDAVREYIAHPVLRARLLEITEAVCTHLEAGVPLVVLMGGSVDEEKLRESLTLFALVAAASHWDAMAGTGRSETTGGGGNAITDEFAASYASVAQLSCRALAASSQRTLCEQSVRTLTSAAVGLGERWGRTLDPLELAHLSGCIATSSGAELATSVDGPRRVGTDAGKRGRQDISGATVEEVEAQLAGVDKLSLADEDLDLVLPSDGFQTLTPNRTSADVD